MSRLLRMAACASCLLCLDALAAQPPSMVPLAPGLAFTTTTHAGLVSSSGALPVADTETVYSVSAVGPDKAVFSFTVSGGADKAASAMVNRAKHTFERDVSRSDLQTAARTTILFSSTDPQILPGQTFAGTSAAVIEALRSSGQIAFVLGINEPDQGLGMLAGAASALPPPGPKGVPVDLGGFLAGLAVVRHYYRGTLKRIGTGAEPFSVLLNGKRSTVPALHVRGDMTFTDRTLTPELWWLDDPANPVMLKWMISTDKISNYEVVTRINVPPQGTEEAGGAQAAMLAGKDCRAELSGVYFTTGSAEVLEASLPALQRFAALMAQHSDWVVTIEGHTDNIGSAEYNLDLSTRRANAVREVLVAQLKVPANRVEAKGYGLTRPVETNATDEGRAHNRRVEVSRNCH